MKVKWTALKNFMALNSADLSYLQDNNFYIVTASKGKVSFHSVIAISIPANANQTDFETNYKSSAINFGTSDIQTVSINGLGMVGDAIKVSGASFVGSNDSVNSKMRIDVNMSPQLLTGIYSSVYSYTGSGKLFGGKFIVDSEDISLRLLVDSEIIFDVNIKDLEDITDNTPFDVNIDDEDSEFSVEFNWPIVYATSVDFQAKSSGDNIEKTIISLSKEI